MPIFQMKPQDFKILIHSLVTHMYFQARIQTQDWSDSWVSAPVNCVTLESSMRTQNSLSYHINRSAQAFPPPHPHPTPRDVLLLRGIFPAEPPEPRACSISCREWPKDPSRTPLCLLSGCSSECSPPHPQSPPSRLKSQEPGSPATTAGLCVALPSPEWPLLVRTNCGLADWLYLERQGPEAGVLYRGCHCAGLSGLQQAPTGRVGLGPALLPRQDLEGEVRARDLISFPLRSCFLTF